MALPRLDDPRRRRGGDDSRRLDRWHTYAADWEPGLVRWYYDGDLISTLATGAIGVPHYLVMMASDWEPSDPSGPATTRIDYVRVWQHDPVPYGLGSRFR